MLGAKLSFILSLFFLFALDRLSKWFIWYGQFRDINIVPGISLSLYFNSGLAFGWSFPTILLTIIIILAVLLLSLLAYRLYSQQKFIFLYFVLLLILGGFSNLLDRWRWGGVLDFLEVWHWPVFNLADFYITISIVALIYLTWFKDKERRE